MTDEERFQQVVLERIYEARETTGYSFAGLLKLIDDIGAEAAAHRLIYNSEGDFQRGMRVLFDADLLHLSVEQAVIEFGERGEIFTADDVETARQRLQTMKILFSRKLRDRQ